MSKLIAGMLLFSALCLSFPTNTYANSYESFADNFASSAGIKAEEAKKNIELVFAELTKQLETGNSVTIRNFGKFYVSERDPRSATNPNTGEKVQVPARKYPKFKSSDVLKRQLNSR